MTVDTVNLDEWTKVHSFLLYGTLCPKNKFWKRGFYLSKSDAYVKRTEELVLPMVDEKGFELVDVEYVKEANNWYLRVYLDKPGGITIDDLTLINHQLSDKMDEIDFIEEAYILEVSSPGLLRPLTKERDFLRNIGNEVEIKLFSPFTWEENGKKFSSKELEGTLIGYEDHTVTLQFDDGEELSFAQKDIALIRKSIDF